MPEVAIPFVDAPQKISWGKNLGSVVSEALSPIGRKIARHLPRPVAHDLLTQSMQLSLQQRRAIAHEAIRNERSGGSPDIRTIAYHVQAGGFPENVQREILRHQINALWVDEDGFSGSREVKDLCQWFHIDHATRKPFPKPTSGKLSTNQQVFNAALKREAALSYAKTQVELIHQGEALRALQPRGRERLRRWIEAKKEERPWRNAPAALDYFTQGMSPILLETQDPQFPDMTYTTYHQMQAAAKELCYADNPNLFQIAHLMRSSGASKDFVRRYFIETALPPYRDALYKRLATKFPEEFAKLQTTLMTLYHERHSRTKMNHSPALPADDVPYKEADFAIRPKSLLRLLPLISPDKKSEPVNLREHQAFSMFATYLHCADAYASHGGQGSPYIGKYVTSVMPRIASE